ncbi:MAG: IS21 family transposase [bacterium]
MSKTQQDQIIALGKLGWSLRKIEETTGCRRETAGKYLRAAGVPVRASGRWGHGTVAAAAEVGAEAKAAIQVSQPRNGQQSLCEPHRAEIAALVDRGVAASVIFEELVGFTGGYSSLKRFVRKLRAETRRRPPVGTIVTGPGKEAQVDYGQGPLIRTESGRYVRSRLFVMTLGWSRKAVYLLALSSSSEMWCSLHERAFRELGGTTEIVVLDNLREGVKAPDYCDPELNEQYAQTMKHFKVIAIPARVRDPDRKGKVERGVGYAQLRLEHRKFESLAEAQAFLDHWVATVADERVHKTTQRVVKEHFAEERAHLKPLPAEPCRRFSFGRRKVTSTGYVDVEAKRYAAPASHVSTWVQVQHNDDVVRLIDEATGALLVEHRRHPIADAVPAGAAAANKGAAGALSSSPTTALLVRARQLGPNIGTLCASIAATDPEEMAVRRMHAILKRVQSAGADHVDRACACAIAAGAPTYRCVQAWLDHHRPVGLTQVDSLIRQLATYRDVVARLSSTTTTQETQA